MAKAIQLKQVETRIDIEKAVRFVFEDPDWVKKILIATVLPFTIIGLFPLLGWGMEIMRRASLDETDLLPDWSDLGDKLVLGFKTWVVGLIWGSPMILIVPLFMAMALVPVVYEMGWVAEEIMITLMGGSMLVFVVALPIILVFSYGLMIIYPLIYGQFNEDQKIGSSLNPRRTWALLRANWVELIVVAILVYTFSYIISMVGMLLCFVGIFFVFPISMAVMYFLYGQAYRNSLIKLEAREAA
jgi:hypothetical protein